MDYPQLQLLAALAETSLILAFGIFGLVSAQRGRKDLLTTPVGAANLVLAFMLVSSLGLGAKWAIERTAITRRAVLQPLTASRDSGPRRLVRIRDGPYIDAWGAEVVNQYYDEAERRSVSAAAKGWRLTARWKSSSYVETKSKPVRSHTFVFEFDVPGELRLNEVLFTGSRCFLNTEAGGHVAFCHAGRSDEGTLWTPPATTAVDFYWTPKSAGLRPAAFNHSREVVPVAWGIDHLSISRRGGILSVRLPLFGKDSFLARLDQASLTFGRTGDERSLVSCDRGPRGYLSDCHFDAAKAGIQAEGRRGVLKGRTVDGILIIGIGGIPGR